jgi:hypothetical protein
MGIGKIPDAVLAALGDHHDLGIHTEMFSDGVKKLVELGVINGREKTLLPGKIVSSFIMGSRELYEWSNKNPMVEMRPSQFTNDPFTIARNDRMMRHQLGARRGPHGPGRRRHADGPLLLRHRRPGRLHPRGLAQPRRKAHHRAPLHRQERHREPHPRRVRGGRRRRHEPRRRPLRGHRARRRRSLGQEHPPARARPHRDRAPGLPRGADGGGQGPQIRPHGPGHPAAALPVGRGRATRSCATARRPSSARRASPTRSR